jgi:two-component system LytT family sensor kinase
MAHPIATRKIYLLSYSLVWMIISIIHAGVLFYYYDLGIMQSSVDSLIVNVLHATTGLAIWFPVRFNSFSPRRVLTPLINLFATGALTVAVWVGLSYLLLKEIFNENPVYIEFLETSIPNRIIIDTLFFTLLVMVYSLVVYSINLREKMDGEVNLRTLVRDAELSMLKTQINPHFLFNSLNSISHLIKKNPDRAREMIIKLSEFLRFSLKYGEDENIKMNEELENMERYLQIEKTRFGDKLNYIKNIDPNSLDSNIPNMILQPLLENAIKHGVYESTEPIDIILEVSKKERSLEIRLKNDYDPESIPKKGAGIGLKNIEERLKLLYGRMDLIDYSGENGIFTVKLTIPQKQILIHD